MPRLFQFTSPLPDGQALEAIDLDKVCRLRVEDRPDGVHVKIWFFGGQQIDEPMPRALARELLDAYASFLTPSS